MALLKYAKARLLGVDGSPAIRKHAHLAHFTYDPRPGYLYARTRAISSRTNDNYDHFAAEEIASERPGEGWRTFLGKPVFVNHHNDDPLRARGVIIDAALHRDANPDGSPDVWVELLHEIDAVRFPLFAQAIINGEIDRTSMGVNVRASICTACGNIAELPSDYCQHVRTMKGKKYARRDAATGEVREIVIAEKCVGLSFFEDSWLVEEPADPTAYGLGVDTRGLNHHQAQAIIHEAAPVVWDDGSHPNTGPNVRVCPIDGNQPVEQIVHDPGVDPYAIYRLRCGHWVTEYDYRSYSMKIVPAPVSAPTPAPSLVNASMGRTEIVTCDTPGCRQRTGYGSEAHHGWVHRDGSDFCSPEHAAQGGKRGPRTAPKANQTLAAEQIAVPPKVDTLRRSTCPVCGEDDAWSGQTCQICGYVTPPEFAQDPDTDAASALDDLRNGDDALPKDDDDSAVPDEDDDSAVPDDADPGDEGDDDSDASGNDDASDVASKAAPASPAKGKDDDDQPPWLKDKQVTKKPKKHPTDQKKASRRTAGFESLYAIAYELGQQDNMDRPNTYAVSVDDLIARVCDAAGLDVDDPEIVQGRNEILDGYERGRGYSIVYLGSRRTAVSADSVPPDDLLGKRVEMPGASGAMGNDYAGVVSAVGVGVDSPTGDRIEVTRDDGSTFTTDPSGMVVVGSASRRAAREFGSMTAIHHIAEWDYTPVSDPITHNHGDVPPRPLGVGDSLNVNGQVYPIGAVSNDMLMLPRNAPFGFVTPAGRAINRARAEGAPSQVITEQTASRRMPIIGTTASRRTAIADPNDLNTLAEFDTPFEVTSDGNVITNVSGVYAPEVYESEGDTTPTIEGSGWEFVDGYSGQSGYSGPVMHPSEQLAGGIARDVMANPGIYVVTAVEDPDDPDNPSGWVLLKKTGSRRTADYNGWSNRATWAANVAMGNFEGLYHQVLSVDDPDELAELVTPYLADVASDVDPAEVDWQELVDAWAEDRNYTGSRRTSALTDAQYDALLAAARSMGQQDSPGNGSYPDLSGEWADTPGGPAVFAAICQQVGVDPDDPDVQDSYNDVLDAYEDGHLRGTASRTSQRRVAVSDICPKCGAHMENVTIHGSTLRAHCDSCGWSGSKTRASRHGSRRVHADTSDVLDALNSYDGENIWGDVIWHLPGYDEDATEVLDQNGRSDRFVADGVTYIYQPGQFGGWQVRTASRRIAGTWMDDLRESDPQLAAAYDLVGNQDRASLRNMVKALQSMPFLNSPEDEARLQAAQYILRHRIGSRRTASRNMKAGRNMHRRTAASWGDLWEPSNYGDLELFSSTDDGEVMAVINANGSFWDWEVSTGDPSNIVSSGTASSLEDAKAQASASFDSAIYSLGTTARKKAGRNMPNAIGPRRVRPVIGARGANLGVQPGGTFAAPGFRDPLLHPQRAASRRTAADFGSVAFQMGKEDGAAAGMSDPHAYASDVVHFVASGMGLSDDDPMVQANRDAILSAYENGARAAGWVDEGQTMQWLSGGEFTASRRTAGVSSRRAASRLRRRAMAASLPERELQRTIAKQQAFLEEQGHALSAIAAKAGVDLRPFIQRAVKRIADVDNPADPVPDPPAQAAPYTQQETINVPTTDVESPGASPVTDTSPDAKVDVTTDQAPVDANPLDDAKQTDVSAPVSGTETNTENRANEASDVIGTPSTQTFDTNTLGSRRGEDRFVACLRLARMRMQAGIAPPQDDLVLAKGISDSPVGDAEVRAEITTLSKVLAAKPKVAARQPRIQRAPSLAPTALPLTEAANTSLEAELLW